MATQLLDRLERNSVFEMFWSGFLMFDVISSTFPLKVCAFLSLTHSLSSSSCTLAPGPVFFCAPVAWWWSGFGLGLFSADISVQHQLVMSVISLIHHLDLYAASHSRTLLAKMTERCCSLAWMTGFPWLQIWWRTFKEIITHVAQNATFSFR